MSDPDSPPRAPSLAERAVLQKLLGAEFSGRDVLLQQMDGLMVKSIDTNGSLELSSPHNAPATTITDRIPVEAELNDTDGMTIHVLLHVVGGFLSELEIYREDSAPVQRQISADNLRLTQSASWTNLDPDGRL